MVGIPYIKDLLVRTYAVNSFTNSSINVGTPGINDFASDGKFLYGCVYQGIGKIIKIDLKTFTLVGSLTITAIAPTSIVIAKGEDGENYLYAVAYDVPCIISKIRLSDFTEVDTLTLSTSPGYPIASYGTYLYVGHGQYVTRISTETFTEIGTVDIGVGVGAYSLLCLGTYLYVGTSQEPGKLIKINTDTFTIDSTLTFAAGEVWVTKLTTDGTHIYAGFWSGQVVKIDVINFSKVGTTIQLYNVVSSMTCDSKNLYCGLRNEPYGVIAKIDINTFQLINYITTTGNQVLSLYQDEMFLYAGFYTTRIIERISIIPSIFTKCNVFIENTGESVVSKLIAYSYDGTPYLGDILGTETKCIENTNVGYGVQLLRRVELTLPALLDRAYIFLFNCISENICSTNSCVAYNSDPYDYQLSELSSESVGDVPDQITDLSAVPGDKSCTILWTPPGNIPIKYYEVYLLIEGISLFHGYYNNNTVNISNLHNGTVYTIYIAALSDDGIIGSLHGIDFTPKILPCTSFSCNISIDN